MKSETSEKKKRNVGGHVHYGIQKTALDVTKWVGSPFSIIIHSIIFVGVFWASFGGLIPLDRMLLVLTTVVSLESIYLSILIQMTINYTTQSVEEVAEDIEEIQEDLDEIQEDVDEIQEDVDELQEDVEEISEEEKGEELRDKEQKDALADIHSDLKKLVENIDKFKSGGSGQ